MDLSIIIVNRNTSNLLIQCLESIYGADLCPTFEIIVVDNGSTDDSVDVCTMQFPNVHIISNDRNLGFAKANNQGLALAKGRYFLLLNSDTIVLPGALDEMVRVADAHKEVGAIGPKLLQMNGTLQKSWSSFPTFWTEVFGKQNRLRHPIGDPPIAHEVDCVGGACLLVRSETAGDVGLLDEDYLFYSEEVDWCFRIKKKGWKVWYLSNAEIYHLGGGSAKRSSLTQMGLLYKSKIHFFRKFHGPAQATLLRYGLVFAYSLGLIRNLLLFKRMNKEMFVDRVQIRAQLVWCLLQNKFPEVLS